MKKELILFVVICIGLIFYLNFFQGKGFLDNSLEAFSSEKIPSTKIMLGQNFIIGIPGTEIDAITEEILREVKPGGIVLYRRNYRSPEQFKFLIDNLQMIAQEDGSVPYFVMIDEEPNGATRLDLLKDVFTLGLPNWGEIDQGIKTLNKLGINVELAPVVDFPFNENSFIRRRVPVDNLDDLKDFNKTFIGLLKDHDISATLKHFPGAGVFTEDPHEIVPSHYVDEEYFNQSISLFEDGMSNGADFVMINHAIYENIDKENPATLSYSIVTGLLKDQIGFDGIIITDDIEDMLSLVWNIDSVDAGIRSLKAGNTMIMYSQSISNTQEIFNGIKKEIEKNKELENIVRENYYQITSFKEDRF